MNRIFKTILAASLLASTVIAASPAANANSRHHWKEAHFASCEAGPGVPLLLVGAVLGAVTGGVAAGVAYGAVYTAGGAAIGAGAGTTLAVFGGGLNHGHCW